jgi:FdhD protein
MPEDTQRGAAPATYTTITRKGAQITHAQVIHEQAVSLYVNGQEIVTAMASPVQQIEMALGFLANEGVIDSMDEVDSTRLCAQGSCADIWLTHPMPPFTHKPIITSGCGGGLTFDDLTAEHPALTSDQHATPDQLWALMEALQQSAELYSRARGVHTSALADGEKLVLVAEDVGRHNTLDKLRGMALMKGIDTREMILLTTGRVSSEMIGKARQMGTPIVCSRTSPTSLSVTLAEKWNITLVGYLRRSSMNVYTGTAVIS